MHFMSCLLKHKAEIFLQFVHIDFLLVLLLNTSLMIFTKGAAEELLVLLIKGFGPSLEVIPVVDRIVERIILSKSIDFQDIERFLEVQNWLVVSNVLVELN